MISKNYAWATVVTKTKYEASAGRLYQGLKYFKSKYPMVIMVTDNLTEKDLPFLTKNNIPYVKVPLLRFSDFNNYGFYQKPYNETLSKFNIFSLINYDYVCFIDADIILNNNIDIIFNKINLSFNFNFFSLSDRLILGEIFSLKPRNNMLSEVQLKKLSSNCEADEEVLDTYFRYQSNIQPLPIICSKDYFHFSGAFKFWELISYNKNLCKLSYDWYYESSIDEFYKKFILNMQNIGDAHFKCVQAVDIFFKDFKLVEE